MKRIYISLLIILSFIGGCFLGNYFTTSPTKALYIRSFLDDGVAKNGIEFFDTDKRMGEFIDEYIFGLMNSEKELDVTLPNRNHDYVLNVSSADNSIWWLEHYIWIDADNVIITSKNDDVVHNTASFSKNSGVYLTLKTILNEYN